MKKRVLFLILVAIAALQTGCVATYDANGVRVIHADEAEYQRVRETSIKNYRFNRPGE